MFKDYIFNDKKLKLSSKFFFSICSGAAFGLATTVQAISTVNPNDNYITPANVLVQKEERLSVGDDIATTHYSEMRKAFHNGSYKQLQFKVFEFRNVRAEAGETVQRRASELGFRNSNVVYLQDDLQTTSFSNKDIPANVATLSVVQGQRELRINLNSGTETYIDQLRFHKGEGIPEVSLMSEGRYLAKAREYMQKSAKESGVSLVPYKKRYYKNALAYIDSQDPPQVSVYQVAVAFNRVIDGRYAEIGPGAKVSIQMSPRGELIAYEKIIRPLGSTVKILSGDQLLAPDTARQMVESRLRADGKNISDYKLVRAEFGYFERGRNSVQKYLIPTYGFIYEPISTNTFARKLVETIPATTDKSVLSLYSQDEAAEKTRKNSLIKDVVEDVK